VKGAISSAKNELIGPQSVRGAGADPFERWWREVYERYARALRDANAFDFDDLLVKPVELLRAHPPVLAATATASPSCWSTSTRTPTARSTSS
jgi:DNA helicase II / ATP-dependent DNA helicase PcrA